MLRNASYIFDNVITGNKEHCKKAQVGVDLSVNRLFAFGAEGVVLKDKTFVPEYAELPAGDYYGGPTHKEGTTTGWLLNPGTYILETNESCSFGENGTGYIIMRSSLNRCGVTIHSAVWDPGFNSGDNKMTIRMTVENPNGFFLEKNARVAQLIVFENELTELYDGQFQGGRTTSKLVEEK